MDTAAATPNARTKPTFEDITLFDAETGEPFIFSAKEQEFFWKQGFTNVPKYSPERRKQKREERFAGKVVSNVRCKICGKVGKVLQEVTDPQETHCGECFDATWQQYLANHPAERAAYEQAEAAYQAAKQQIQQ
jgi:hypothetical protein